MGCQTTATRCVTRLVSTDRLRPLASLDGQQRLALAHASDRRMPQKSHLTSISVVEQSVSKIFQQVLQERLSQQDKCILAHHNGSAVDFFSAESSQLITSGSVVRFPSHSLLKLITTDSGMGSSTTWTSSAHPKQQHCGAFPSLIARVLPRAHPQLAIQLSLPQQAVLWGSPPPPACVPPRRRPASGAWLPPASVAGPLLTSSWSR